jgi:hypothetical protein
MKLLYKLKWVALVLTLHLSANNAAAQAFTENFDDITTLVPGGWFMQNNSSPVGVLSWFQGNGAGVFPAFNGGVNAYIGVNYNSTTGNNTISNWLLTPARVFHNGDVLTFYTRTSPYNPPPNFYPDRLQVRMSTNGTSTNVGTTSTSVGDFTTLLLDINATLVNDYPHVWTQYTVTISGLPAPVQGRFAFRYFVTSGGPSGANSDYIGIDNVVYTPNCNGLAIMPATLTNATVGVPYTQTFSLTDGFGTVNYNVTAGALPPGMTLSTAGTLSGTPTATGTFNFSITTTDGSSCTKTAAYTMIVSCPTVTIAPTTLPDATAGALYSQNITLSGSTAVSINYTVTAGTLPAGINLTLAGVLGGAATTPGTYNFTITGTDQYGCSASQAYTLIVNCPTITVSPTTLANGVVGTAYVDAITSTGGIGSIAYSVSGTLPQGITIDNNGFVTGTPTLPGTYNFTVIATDINNCTGQQAYTLIIDCQPISIDQLTIPGGTVNAAYAQTLTQTGGIGTGSYAVSAGALPTGITLAADGTISGTPTVSGSYNFDVTFTDDNGCIATQSYMLAIACQTITIDQTTQPDGVAGVTYAGTTITQTGGLGTATFAVTSGALPAGVTLNTDGSFAGAPSVTGTFTFEVTASDVNGCTSNSQSFTINIACPSVSIDQSTLPDAYYNTPYAEVLTQTGGVGAITYTMTGGALPAGLTMDAAGNITGTPTVGPGFYSIDVQAEDANGCQSSVQTITFGTNWPLAITLVDFSARSMADGKVMINWETQHIEGTEQFFVEHSADGKNFTTVASEKAVRDQVKYNTIHDNASQGTNYYRLRSVELNGEVSYSKIVRLSGKATAQQVALLPNMITDKATLQVTANEAGSMQLRIIDITGREIYQQSATINAGQNAIMLDLHTLPVATYTMQVIVNNEMLPVKFVKM